MKTKQLIILVLLLSVYILSAQTADKPATVRMKTKTIVNGVVTEKDTTFQTSEPGTIMMVPSKEGNGTLKGSSKVIVLKNQDTQGLDSTISSLIKEVEKDREPKEGETFVIKKVKCGATKEEIDNVQEEIVIMIGKRIDIVEANEEDIKKLNTQTGTFYRPLVLDKLNFYPNPSDGKFNLSFSSTKKADTEITIQNVEGKTIFHEKAAGVSGAYTKEIDISQHPKGVYFMKIVQGSDAQIKKIVIE